MVSGEPTLSFLCEMDERAFCEIELKGVFRYALANLPDGAQVRLSFWDPIRLLQDLQTEIRLGRSCLGEPGLIVIPKVTVANMTAAIKDLYHQGYFDRLKAVFQ